MSSGLAHFVTVVMPAKLNKMKNDLTEVSTEWFSESGRLSSMRVEEKFLLNFHDVRQV